MKKHKRIVFLSAMLIFLVALAATFYMNTRTAKAIDDSVLDRHSQNGIYFYDPDEKSCGDVIKEKTTSSSDVTDSASSLSDQQIAFVVENYQAAQTLSVSYGIPWETVVAQGILESASGTSQLAIDKNNFFGIGAYDSCPYTCAFSYATKAEGWEGYYKNIVKTETYRNHGVFQGDTITDPYSYTVAIKAAGYATDPDYVSKVNSLVDGIVTLSKENGWLSSAELAEKYPEMLENAAKNAQGANAELTTSEVSGGAKECKDNDSTENGVTYATYNGAKYAFPLLNASKETSSGNGYLSTLPCDHSIGCHYGPGASASPGNSAAAFDMCLNGAVDSRQCVGTKVVSMADGHITRVTYTRGGEQCNHVRIRSDSDSKVIAYIHLAYDPEIVEGVDVKAGDIIGEVTDVSACHDNSTPHVHIDKGNEVNATGGPMEPDRNPEIVPIMNAVYDALPETEEELQSRMKTGGKD